MTRTLQYSMIRGREYVCWADDMQNPITEPWEENPSDDCVRILQGTMHKVCNHNRINLFEERLDRIEKAIRRIGGL